LLAPPKCSPYFRNRD
jgi:hypothetical protein